MIMMDNIVIEINGVRHRLVESKGQCFKCDICSLYNICEQSCIRLCTRFRDVICHFEIETKNNV